MFLAADAARKTVARCETSGRLKVNELCIKDAPRITLGNVYSQIFLFVAAISIRIFNAGDF
jgi:hypothetical protein